MVPSGKRQFSAAVSITALLRQYYSMTPRPDVSLSRSPALLAEAENFTVLIKSSITYPKFGLHRSVDDGCTETIWALIRTAYANMQFYCVLLPSGRTFYHTSTPHTCRAVNTIEKRTLNAPYSASATSFLRPERTFKTLQ